MIYVPLIYFTLLFVFLYIRYNSFNVGSYLNLIYIISSLFAVIIDFFDLYLDNNLLSKQPISILAATSYCVLLTVTIFPFYKFRSDRIVRIINTSSFGIYRISLFFIVVFYVVLIINFYDLIQVFRGDYSAIREIVNDENIDGGSTGIKHVGAILVTLFSRFSPMLIFFYFYSISYLKYSKLFNTSLLLSSFTPVISGILIAGRTQVVYWVLSFLLVATLFKHILPKIQKRKITILIISITSLFVIYLSSVTISRWSKQGAYDSIIVYAGQSYINYCNYFDNYTNTQFTFDRVFPVISKYILGRNFDLLSYRDNIFSLTGFNIGVFYTFLGDLIVDIGHIGMLIYVALFYFLTSKFLKRTIQDHISLSQIFLFLVFVHLPLQGVFYYSYWRIDMGFYVIGSIFLHFMYKYKLKF
jgi:oligosaccharide repeat unit polymerase